jgi:glycosyltransferase involved in cell wall biosynthesis
MAHSLSVPGTPPLRIAYDARLSLGQYRGMGRFLRMLIAGREREFIGFCAPGEKDEELNLFASGFASYPLWEQIALPRLMRSHKIGAFLAPYNTAPLRMPKAVKLILVVHDLIFMERLPFSPSLYQNVGRIYRRFVVPRAIRRADTIVTVSNHTARELVSRFALDPGRVRVIPNSIGEEWFSADAVPAASPHYVLMVAGEAPSKNLSRAIAAFASCRGRSNDSTLRLKVAGVKQRFQPAFQAEARQLGVGNFVDFLPYLSDAEMRQLYRQAALFVMPSLAEGFGIPVLEAMASGLPVAASSATCFEEIGGDAVRYFNPYSIDNMAEVMHNILANPALQAEMSARGQMQARKFHPDVVREQVRSFWIELEQSLKPARSEENSSW